MTSSQAQHIGRLTIAAATLAALVTACGTAKPSAGNTATSGTNTTPASSPSSSTSSNTATTPATTATTGSGPGASTPPSAPGCLSRYLHAGLGASQGTAGSVYVAIVFTNLNNQTCTLYGYPGVSLAAGSPVRQVGLAATENPTPPRELVTLQPHGTANALLRVVEAGNYSPGQCGPVTTNWLQVFPPNQTVPLYVHYSGTGCSKAVHLLSVNVVQPGSGS